MLANYLKIALRNLRRQGLYTFTNVVGLAVAVAACLLIQLFLRHELSFDAFHRDAARIYRVGERGKPGEPYAFRTRARLLPALAAESPAVAAGTRAFETTAWIRRGDGQRFEASGLFVDTTFFDVFSFPLVAGDAATALRHDGILLSETLARKYFGDEDPVGQTVNLDLRTDHVVRGVLRDFPANSTVQAEFLLPYAQAEQAPYLDWNNTLMPTYVRLREGARPADVATAMDRLIMRHADADRQATFTLMPLRSFHLGTENERSGASRQRTLLSVLGAIALAIVVVASINFANLATARSLGRAREIGMRKVLGARRLQLAAQFVGEALLVAFVATAGGAALAELMLPAFNHLVEAPLALDYAHDPGVLVLLLATGLAVGLLAGLYPALHLSGFQPIEAVKGRLHADPRGARVRHALVVAQFTVSVLLLVGTLVVWQQIRYMKSQDLRFDAENVVVVPVAAWEFADEEDGAARLATLKAELLRHSRVVSVSSTKSVPGEYAQWGGAFTVEGRTDEVHARWTQVDAAYFSTFGLRFVEGRSFSDSLAGDVGRTAVINETARRAFGWETAVGKTLRFGPGDAPVEVVGVVADFYYQSLQAEIEPLVHFFPGSAATDYHLLAVKITPGPVAPVLDFLDGRLRALDPSRTFDYTFADDHFARLYEDVERSGTLVAAFAVLAVLIGCLGLLGLASFAATQRTKEIGVRKVMGASVPQIVWLISRSFARLVLVAFVLAAPVAYVAADRWLEGFAYRISLSWPLFAAAGGTLLVLALATISYQAVRAATADPVDALRYE